MIYQTRQRPSVTDIPLISIRTKPVTSRDILQIIDYSTELQGNQRAVTPFYTTNPDTGGKLDKDTLFQDTMITNHFHHDPRTGTSEPLWYIHYLSGIYYSKNILDRRLKRTVKAANQEDRIIKNIVGPEPTQVIVERSIVAKVGDTVFPVHLDHTRKWIYLPEAAEDKEYIVEFRQMEVDIYIPFMPEYINIKVEPATPELSDLYNLYIITNTREPLQITYNKGYNQFQVQEVTEYTNSHDLFTEVPKGVFDSFELANGARSITDTFYIDNNEIFTNYINGDMIFAIADKEYRNTNIRIEIPEYHSFTEPWYPVLKPGITHTFDIRFADIQTRLESKHVVKQLGTHEISLGASNIEYSLLPDGTIEGINIYTVIGRSIPIERFNPETGLVTTRTPISMKDVIMAEYSYLTNGQILKNVNLNPLDFNSLTNRNIRESYIIYGLTKVGNDTVICSLSIPKVDEGLRVSVDYYDIWSYLNDTYRDKIEEIDNDHTDDIFPLCLIETVNPFDDDAYLIEDSRIFGGGTDIDISRFDISHYNGESVDVSNNLIFTIPIDIRDDLADRLKIWDEETIRAEDIESFAATKSENIIKEKIEKFIPLGTEYEVIWKED